MSGMEERHRAGAGHDAETDCFQMKIIDTHFHFSKSESFDETAAAAGHENSAEHLSEVFSREGIVLGIAMGELGGERLEGVCTPRTPNLCGTIAPGRPYPHPPFVAFCAGLESCEIAGSDRTRSLECFASVLRMKECLGLKLYPGYNTVSLNDPCHDPYYELAEQFDVPVVIHTGELAGNSGLLKYSHPLNVDELAVRFPRVRFVMAHCGNPWITDAVAVAAKNPNVFLDLSGLAEGNISADGFWNQFRGHMEYLRTWLVYLNDWNKVMYGSDWPLVNIPAYLEVIRRLVPEEHHEKAFFGNACRVFSKIPALSARTSEELRTVTV